MSRHPPHEAEAPTPAQEREGISVLHCALYGAGTLTLFGVAVLITFLLMEHWRGPLPAPHRQTLPHETGQAQVNLVYQKDYTLVDDANGEGLAEAHRTLDSYGWMNRDRGLIHIPVERAIDTLAAQPGGTGR